VDKINLFRDVLKSVPAYSEFCKQNGVNENTVWEDIPIIDKPSYLLKYELKDLCRDADLSKAHLIGASSGFSKSGSIFWPKRPEDEKEYFESLENMLIQNYNINKKKTLIMVCLAFGTWIGGMQLATAVRVIALKGKLPITSATPGLNLKEAVEIYDTMSDFVDQVIIITNPSNVNLFISLFEKKGIQINNGNIYFAVVGEFIPEKARIKVNKLFGHKKDEPFAIWTGYGSADAGGIGYETKETILLRRYIYETEDLSNKIFKTKDTPMIFAMIPNLIIEIINDEIVVTKDQMIPLIRYNTKDLGGILKKDDLFKYVPNYLLENLPDEMLFVNGRVSDSVIFYGTNLNVNEINEYFLSLDKDYYYGGLFQVKQELIENVDVFNFTIFTDRYDDNDLIIKYKTALVNFLKESSNEFKIKYEHLNSIVGEKLIKIKLEDVSKLEGNLKHKYIL
jgi:phenylacetate-CoA ligase